MAFKSVKFEIKALDDAGSFTGMASVFGVTDLGGDVVEHGAFAKSLSERGATTPLLWQHKMDEVVGVGHLSETPAGLQVEGKLVFDSNPTAHKVYALMRSGAVKGMSIGYDTVRHVMRNGVRVLQELRLHEVSLTPFPMNEQAVVASVKTLPDHREELRAIGDLRAMISKAMR
jgi:HK97 family phage prohead protease